MRLHDAAGAQFWDIELDGLTVVQRQGKLGNKGRTSKKKHASAGAADAAYHAAIAEKRAEGYAPPDEAGAPADAPASDESDEPDEAPEAAPAPPKPKPKPAGPRELSNYLRATRFALPSMPADGRQAAVYGHFAAVTLRRGQVAVLDSRSPSFSLLHMPAGTQPTEAAAISDETLLLPTGAGFLCFGLSSLEARWQRPGRATCAPMRTAQGYLYATTRSELVHVDKLGQVLWQLQLDGPARGLCEAGPRGVAVAVPGALLVFELGSGALRWQLPASAIAEAPGPSSAGRMLFAIDTHERVAAVDVEIGRWVWQYSVRVPFEAGAIFGARGALCPGPGLLALRDRLGGVILLDSSTGAERWRRPGELTPNPTTPGPISWHDTQLHYVNERGDVLVVEAESNADLDRLIHEPDEYGSPLRRARPETRPYQVGDAWLLVSDSRLELLS